MLVPMNLISSLVIFYLSIFLESVSAVKAKKQKSVTTLIDAKWRVTPLALEAAEYLADENADFFWGYVDNINELDPGFIEYKSPKEYYDLILSEASTFISPMQISVLKFALSLHIYSPKIEMYHQVAIDRVLPEGCIAVADVQGELTCSADEVEHVVRMQKMMKKGKKPDIFNLDHHYPGTQNISLGVVLYGELGTPEFQQFHSKLKHLASAGSIDYVLRHYVKNRPDKKLRLSGYGVELQIKSTEYKAQDDTKVQGGGPGSEGEEEEEEEEIEGFNFNRLKTLYPDKIDTLEQFRNHLLETTSEMAPLKVWQLQDLSLQAAERIMNSPRDEALKVLTHIAQNFPIQARSLVRTMVKPELKKEIKKNQESFANALNIQPSDTALFLNGMFFDMDVTDVISLLEVIRQEYRVMEGLHKIGIENHQMSPLLALDLQSSNQDYAVDIRDSAIMYVNDIEKDKQYSRWSSSLMELLRPTFPGMLRSVRKNLYNMVLVVDPSKEDAQPLLKLAESFYVNFAPLKIGIVFAVNSHPDATGNDDPGIAFLTAFNYISELKNNFAGLSFITEVYARVENDVTVKDIQKQLKSNYPSVILDDVFGEDSEYDTGRQLAKDFVERSGFKRVPQVLINGVPLAEKLLNSNDFEEAVLTEIMNQTPMLQKAVYKGELSDSDNVLDFIMGQPNVMPRLNDRILHGKSQYLDMAGDGIGRLALDTFSNLSARDMTGTIVKHMKYITRKDDDSMKILTNWIIADLDSVEGRHMVGEALEQLRATNAIRVGIIFNPADVNGKNSFSKLVHSALKKLRPDQSRQYLAKILQEDTAEKIISGKMKPSEVTVAGADLSGLDAAVQNTGEEFLKIHQLYSARVLKLKPGARGVISNGRILAPLDEKEKFMADDFNLLEKYSMNVYGDKVVQTLKKVDESNDISDSGELKSDTVMQLIGLLVSRPQTKSRFEIPFHGTEHSVIKLPPQMPGQPAFEITVIVDPVSRGAQKVGPILSVLQEVINCNIRVFLNSVEKISGMPLQNFYRYVLDSEVQFTTDGMFAPGPIARFTNLPTSPIFTLNMHVPENWLVESITSPYDLDNIRLDDVESIVYSEFELEYLLLEGHCFELTMGNPPRGLQITLGTNQQPVVVDTIVMANLGYFQLKANPGAWILRLRQGRSSEIFNIASHDNTDTPDNSDDIKVLISSFRSHVIKLKVAKKPDKLNMDLLSEDDPTSGIWNSITSTFGSQKEEEPDNTINIFSLASGHLYERFIRIMMLSVVKHTKSHVKFWFLKNYLSPTFKNLTVCDFFLWGFIAQLPQTLPVLRMCINTAIGNDTLNMLEKGLVTMGVPPGHLSCRTLRAHRDRDFLPHMAKEYKFDYELVQYKWPRWLHQQTEKQRIIWGYKILFLDVLFPLDVKKIIFVDADQVVRADMKELTDLDMGGAPYGYTPFCDSRREMEGFRFWNQGYWKNHLQGRKYHISALYVVDLKRFRRVAAGDRLRGQYQALSQDPNSLSNLDQDLPNNMIHQVTIKSLPQEWLWCETWCDDASKKYAKTIDLCNNPMTKEAKLTAAMRIISEWKDYDTEIKILQEKVAAEEERMHEDMLSADLKDGAKHTEL